MTKVYLFGYQGQDIEAFAARVEALDAVIYDIRYFAASRAPQWHGRSLAKRFGHIVEEAALSQTEENRLRYFWIQQWGNRNYREFAAGKPVEIVDFQSGLGYLKCAEYFDIPAVILLCACAHQGCHRYLIAEQLKTLGYEVEDLVL